MAKDLGRCKASNAVGLYPTRLILTDFCEEKWSISSSSSLAISYGYAYVCFFDLNHFSFPIESAKPKRPGYGGLFQGIRNEVDAQICCQTITKIE